jgi:hypothetical protein
MNDLKKYAGLLNDLAPKNHLLAYITPQERDMLVDAGGVKTPTPSGIFAYPPEGQYGSSGTGSYDGGSTGMASTGGSNFSSGENTPSGDNSPAAGGSGDDSGSNQNNFVPTSSYDEAGLYENNILNKPDVDAEDEYLAPDPDHYKATQKAIGKTNQELRELGLDKSDWTDYTKEEQDAYQKEMNRLNNTEGKNYSFYKGNKGTTNLTLGEHWKDTVVTDPFLKASPLLRFLVAAGRTIKENATTDYGTGKYGGYTADGMGSGQPIDKGGWIGRVFNSDGSVNQNLSETEINDLYNQAQVELPNIISNTTPQDSMVNKYFDNMLMTQGSPLSSDLQISYNNAKSKVNSILGIVSPDQQFGYSNDPYSGLLASNVATNPFNIPYLKQRGLI